MRSEVFGSYKFLYIMSSVLFSLKIPSDPVQMPRAMGSLEVQVCVVYMSYFSTITSDGSLVTWG